TYATNTPEISALPPSQPYISQHLSRYLRSSTSFCAMTSSTTSSMCTWSNSQTAFDFSDTRIFKEGMKMSTKTEHKIALAFEDGSTKFIPCAEDQTVADAAYQSKINIHFHCRVGACGT